MPAKDTDLSFYDKAGYFTSNLLLRGLIGTAQLMPYRIRIPTMGWLVSRVMAPLAGYRKRIRNNLKLARPDLDEDAVAQLVRDVPDNAGRMVMEYYSTRPFVERAKTAPVTGPGAAALEEARSQGRPVIVVTAHFGNYEAVRAAVRSRGHEIGVLYRRMANPYFNEHYVRKLAALGEPCFEQGRRGMVELVRHLRAGGILGILNDLHAHGGSELAFFGQPAVTSTVTAELALKYNAVLIPMYGVRQPNGLDFAVEMHAPIPHTDPETMTQAVNDDLEAMVRQHMGQWFWIHRRWKPWGALGLQPADTEDN